MSVHLKFESRSKHLYCKQTKNENVVPIDSSKSISWLVVVVESDSLKSATGRTYSEGREKKRCKLLTHRTASRVATATAAVARGGVGGGTGRRTRWVGQQAAGDDCSPRADTVACEEAGSTEVYTEFKEKQWSLPMPEELTIEVVGLALAGENTAYSCLLLVGSVDDFLPLDEDCCFFRLDDDLLSCKQETSCFTK